MNKKLLNNFFLIWIFQVSLLSARIVSVSDESGWEHKSQESYLAPEPFKASPFKIPEKCSTASLDSKYNFISPQNKCDFYNCAAIEADKKRVCGIRDKQSYFIEYGEKYCKRFSDSLSGSLSFRGVRWLKKTLVCLQKSLFNGCNSKNKCFDCSSIRELAFDTHPSCYVNSGLCSLDLKDQLSISSTVDLKDLIQVESMVQIGSVVSLCGHRGLNLLTKAAGHMIDDDPIFANAMGKGGGSLFIRGHNDKAKTFALDSLDPLKYNPPIKSKINPEDVDLDRIKPGEILEIVTNADGTINLY
jgi:hypothetical protein